ncbi:tetratricopeptide repeat protein [Spirulina sp. 06S082]|uniref:tetratricopeptide repeat protein n=1 Tax=Spirulina sp. 06S082 TaxID=3110248 RepID=UPI002B1ED817|nr:tetratricopeptide repeat protein [Spirulina sp. 06S082]MEA5470694.1 tetratricopeptide repeat protein [Spirulina sp. 06S082]
MKKKHYIGNTPSDFFGREKELETLQELFQESPYNRVFLISGISGIGKSYLATKLPSNILQDYKVLKLSQESQEICSLPDLFERLKEFLNKNGEYGFDTSYAEEKMKNEVKISSFLETISSERQKHKYAIVIDGFNQEADLKKSPFRELKSFIKLFSEFGYERNRNFEHKLILIGDVNKSSLGIDILNRVTEFNLNGFRDEEAREYIRKCSENLNVTISEKDFDEIIQITDGHPIAINLIIQCCETTSLEVVRKNLVDFDRDTGAFVYQKLVKNIEQRLTPEETQALHHFSIFQTSVKKIAWQYLDIEPRIGECLLRRKLLTRLDNKRVQMHRIFREFWQAFQDQDKTIQLHRKAAEYYWEEGKNSSNENLDLGAYLEARYHFYESLQHELAARVVNELVCRINQQEPLLSQKLSGLTDWILELDENILRDKPWLLLEKGQRFERNGDKENAEIVFQRAYHLFEKQGDELGKCVCFYCTGKILSAKQSQKAAIQVLNSVLEMPKSKEDIRIRIRVLGKLISCYKDLHQYETAWSTAIEAEKLAQNREPLGYALILYRKAGIRRTQSQFYEAEQLFSKSAEAFEKLGDFYRASKSWSRLGVVQERQGKFEQAKYNFEKAIKIKQNLNDQYGFALDLDYLAGVYRSQGYYEDAADKYKKSLKKKEEIGDIYGQAKSYNNLARIALLNGDFISAERYLKKSKENIEILQKRKEKYLGIYGAYWILLGDLQFSLGKYREAVKAYHKAKNCVKYKSHDEARVNLSLGKTYLQIRHICQAKKYLEDAKKVFQGSENNLNKTPYHEVLSLTCLAELSAITGHIKEADNYNCQAMHLAQSIKPVYIRYLETQGFIEEVRILKSQELKNLKNVENYISPVIQYYNQAIEIIKKENQKSSREREISSLQIKKHLWGLKIRLFERISKSKNNHLLTNLVTDNDYKLLNAENYFDELIKIELMKNKETLRLLKSIYSPLAKKLAEYSLHIFSPLARRFGFNSIQEDIEKLAFSYLYPRNYQEINYFLNSNFPRRTYFIKGIKEEVENNLKNAKIKADVLARIKHPYSIYRKLTERKGVSLDKNKILDIFGVRIITQTEKDCYRIKNIILTMGKSFKGTGVLSEEIRDYIQLPKKSTGYQSIHINRSISCHLALGEDLVEYLGYIVEFQIRTYEMDIRAEGGGAAHFIYKNVDNYGRSSNVRNLERQQKNIAKLVFICESPESTEPNTNNLTKIKEAIENSQKFRLANIVIKKIFERDKILLLLNIDLIPKSKKKSWDRTKIQNDLNEIREELGDSIVQFQGRNLDKDLHELMDSEREMYLKQLIPLETNQSNDIYLLSPKGDVYKLPKGATPIDFAYCIHTDVGNQCYQAKVNGKIVPLNTPLQNTDTVEIIKNEKSLPHLDWIKTPEECGNNYPFTVTKSAQKKIRDWFRKRSKNHHFKELIASGSERLKQEFKKLNIELSKDDFESLVKSDTMKVVANSCNDNYRSVQHLLSVLGYYSATKLKLSKVTQAEPRYEKIKETLTPTKVVNELLKKIPKKLSQEILQKDLGKKLYEKLFLSNDNLGKSQTTTDKIDQEKEKSTKSNNSYEKDLYLESLEADGTLISLRMFHNNYHLAECCKPKPYEESLGIITKNKTKVFPNTSGRGILIHRSGCPELNSVPIERRCPIAWNIDVIIEAAHRPNMLSEITAFLGQNKINIEEVQVKKHPQKDDIAEIKIGVDIKNKQELKQVQDICRQIEKMQDVKAMDIKIFE